LYEEEFWNFSEEFFIQSATRFSRYTLLHLYIVTRALNHYHYEFRKNGLDFEEEDFADWYQLFDVYSVEIPKFDLKSGQDPVLWFEDNISAFEALIDRMADEAFYVLFGNRNFLLNFNQLTTKTVAEISFPPERVTNKGTIKRVPIPQWVKKAVFHRDKGRCVFCNRDLTGLVNTLNTENFDHIVPLDRYGTNDPSNIQLTCESCNKSKSNRAETTGNRYSPWWIRNS
jgi:5-methylcytosine-specific restriction endonuclease McrA